MKRCLKIWGSLCIAIIAVQGVYAFNPFAQDSVTNDIFEIEKQSSLQRIDFEKVRIINDYKSADGHFLALTDSVTRFILQLDVSRSQRNAYLERLQVFLKNINRYYSDSYLKNGTYLAILSYYPVMIGWDRKDDMLNNLKRYSSFSIKAVRLIPGDTIAEDFLTDYMKDHQDDIFRYVEEFDDRRFAGRLLEKALRLAPESAKRYYTSSNPVRDLLAASNDVYVKKSFDIYSRFGVKSRAYLLLDAIVKNKMTIEQADSIGRVPEQMFNLLVSLSTRVDANITYSMYRYLDYEGVDAMRRINEYALTPGYNWAGYTQHTPEEMFTLLMYGYKEVTAKTFRTMVDLLQQKLQNQTVNGVMLANMDREKLKELVIYCNKNQLVNQLFLLVDDDKRNYLMGLADVEEKEDLMPPFKSFTSADVSAPGEGYRSINEITKARAPKPLAPDTSGENGIAVKPEKEITGPATAKNITGGTTAPVVKTTPEPTAEIKDVAAIPLPEIIAPVKIDLDPRQRTILMLKKNISKTIHEIPTFIEKDYAEEVLMYAAQKEPDELFKKIEDFKRKYWCKKVLEECAINAPVSVKRYLYNSRQPVNYILQYSTSPVVKKIFYINQQLTYQSKPLLLLDDIVAGKLTTAQAVEISQKPEALYSHIVNIISRPKYLGRYSIDHEMRDYCLHFVREINDKIASGSAQPFSAAESLNAQELYFMMLYGRDEVFTSTFNGLFNRFMQKLPGGNGEAFLKSVSNNKFRDFLSLCSTYGVMEEFLVKIEPIARQKTLAAYITNLEEEQDNLSSIVLVAEAISNLKDYQVLGALETNIKNEYDRVTKANDKIGISIYGVLSSIISGNARTETTWYRRISQQFQVSPVNLLATASLFNEATVCIEQVYFYNDDDGRSSFLNFVNTYRSQPQWTIEDKSNYIRIVSNDGGKVEIFANKPEHEENGIGAIAAYMAQRNLLPSVVVHRGHSFHTEATLEKITGSARLIFVGSCGGFYKISMALENAPDAHIISTKQVGTKTVNDAMLFALNEQIRQGKDIVWNDFWDKMREKLGNNQYFGDYIPPNKNLESTFIRAYYKMLGV